MEEVIIERNVLIRMADGVELASDLVCPPGSGPFPTLLSMYPYHKDDWIGAALDWPRRYFAARGYASLLVDLRGLGGSEGKPHEVMDRASGRDAAAVIEWAARQSWCDGNVGMWGLSYGAYMSLKAAGERPAPLKAVVPIEGDLDLYKGFLYPGGVHDCLFGYGQWSGFMLAMNLMPPTLADREGRWRRIWQARLADPAPPFMMPWRDHPTYDEYWRSKAVDVAAIEVPTFLIGGWRDMFPDSVPRLFAELEAPKRLLMGPWMHTLPDMSTVEPVDYLGEMARWFDRWLKGERNGIEDRPRALFFVQGADAWREADAWPPAAPALQAWHLSADRSLETDASAVIAGVERYEAVPSVGVQAGQTWDPAFLDIGFPFDQGADDRRSLTFDSAPVSEELEILGSPTLRVCIEVVNADDAHLVAKLCAVAPDGRSSLVTSGWLKGSHAESSERPTLLTAGQTYVMDLRLSCTAYRVPRGHRLRLSLSCADFPRMWPTPFNPVIRVHCGGDGASQLVLPLGTDAAGTPATVERPSPPPADYRPLVTALEPRFVIERDEAAGAVAVTTGMTETVISAGGGRVSYDYRATARVADAYPEAARVESSARIAIDYPAGDRIEIVTDSLTTQSGMVLNAVAIENGHERFRRRWVK